MALHDPEMSLAGVGASPDHSVSVIDTSRVGGEGALHAASLSLQGTATTSEATSFSVACSLPGNGAFASDTKLTATKVGEVSSQQDVTG